MRMRKMRKMRKMIRKWKISKKGVMFSDTLLVFLATIVPVP